MTCGGDQNRRIRLRGVTVLNQEGFQRGRQSRQLLYDRPMHDAVVRVAIIMDQTVSPPPHHRPRHRWQSGLNGGRYLMPSLTDHLNTANDRKLRGLVGVEGTVIVQIVSSIILAASRA